MIFGAAAEFAAGLICVIIGSLIWTKQKISLLHGYHYRHVRKEDIPSYTRLIGIGIIIIGAGALVTGFFTLADSSLWWIPLSAGFVTGLTLLFAAQKRFNGSIL